VVLAIAGIVHLAAKPEILVALNPRYALGYVAHADGWVAFTVLGSVFLALTGGEALYADMGHFGRRAIRIDWFSLVMPAFVLNYFGQGALVLSDPAAASNPFFFLFPHGLLVAVVVLTTAVIFSAPSPSCSRPFSSALCRGWRYGRHLPNRQVRFIYLTSTCCC
jgi:KUP system potassium uptake protein